MLRKFTAKDIIRFPEIHILQHKKHDGFHKDYLIIKRKDFISCFVIIDNNIGIFVEQYRPIIRKQTLEVPMGKIEPSDFDREHTVRRELAEEINLTLESKPYILTKSRKNKTASRLYFTKWELKYLGFEYPSPGFSDYKNYKYILQLETEKKNFNNIIEEFEFYSQEPQLKVITKKLDNHLLDQVCGITHHYLAHFLYCYKK